MVQSTSLGLTAYSNADWGSCPLDRKSVSGVCVYFGDSLIYWSSKKQVVSQSSTESEYRALALAATELTWLQFLFKELKISLPTCLLIWCDNMSANSLAANPVCHARSKHSEIDLHFVRD